jgi:hypothetical protein
LAVRIQTARGQYLLSVIGEPERSEAGAIVTLSLERTDGIERIAFRCAIDAALSAGTAPIEESLAPWIQRQFETLREAALKSIRAEGKLLIVDGKIVDGI